MKKIRLLFLGFSILGCVSVSKAQNVSDNPEIQQRIEQRINAEAENYAQRFSLDESKKQEFVTLFKELSMQRMKYFRLSDMSLKEEASKLKDDEAKTKIQEYFDWRSQQIVNEYNRLEMEKQYSEKLSKILTPQQVLEVLLPKAKNNNGREGRGGRRPQGERHRQFDM